MVGWGVGETPWFFSASALMPALRDLTLMSESGLAFVGVVREGLAPLARFVSVDLRRNHETGISNIESIKVNIVRFVTFLCKVLYGTGHI